MPNILITGSEGNIGTFIQKSIREQFPDTHIIRVTRTPKENVSDDIFVGDLRDSAFVSNLFKAQQIEYVIHLAAQTYNALGFRKRAYDLMSHDTQILLNLLDHCANVKKFVYFSSALVYESSEESPFTEDQTDDIPQPRSPYGISKSFGEKAVMAFHAQYAVPYTIWRPFNVVSPLEPHTQEGGHVFVDFYRKIFVEQQPVIEVFGNGDQVRCFTWVEDIASAISAFLFDSRTDNQVFNIGKDEPKTLRELYITMVDIGKEEKLLPQDYNPVFESGSTFIGVDTQLRVPSLIKIEQELGWEAPTKFRDCFTKFIKEKSS